jgi:hypothetical protein
MPRRHPGCPRSTPADRAARLALRTHCRLCLQFEVAHLREAAAVLATQGEQRSLRIQYLQDTAAAGGEPWYVFILYGEPGYLEGDDPPPPDGYIIRVL